jgi:hypothetical protein
MLAKSMAFSLNQKHRCRLADSSDYLKWFLIQYQVRAPVDPENISNYVTEGNGLTPGRNLQLVR